MSRFIVTVASISATIVAIGSVQPSFAQENAAKTQERIGIYDSRAIAVAFAGSPAHQKQLQQLKAERDQAKAAGDLEKVARLEAQGRAQQEKIHQQGFSTAPVDDLLVFIKDALPEIQKAAGVTAIISKWDEAELKKHPGAEHVEVTMKLVDAFQPTERQRNFAIDIQKKKPVSLEELERSKH